MTAFCLRHALGAMLLLQLTTDHGQLTPLFCLQPQGPQGRSSNLQLYAPCSMPFQIRNPRMELSAFSPAQAGSV